MAKVDNAKQGNRYERPQLSVFGSVRNLTGGSMGPNGGDGKVIMQMA